MTFLAAPTRGLTLAFLPETGNVLAGTVVDDGGGGGTVSTTTGADLPCRIDSLSGSEGEAADRVSDRSTHLVTTLAETVITTANQFAIDGRGTFEVTAVREHSAETTRAFEVVARS